MSSNDHATPYTGGYYLSHSILGDCTRLLKPPADWAIFEPCVGKAGMEPG